MRIAQFNLAVATLAILCAPSRVAAQPLMTCQLSTNVAHPGDTVTLTVFLQDAVNVRAYQTRVGIAPVFGPASASVACPGGVAIDTGRPDFIFAGQSNVFPVTNCPQSMASASLLSGGVSTGPGPKYLAHYQLTVSPTAGFDHASSIELQPSPGSILVDPGGGSIPFNIGPPCLLTVRMPALRFSVDGCGQCVQHPANVVARLEVLSPEVPINGVQALFQYDSGVLMLNSVTPGNGQGSPWDGGQIVSFIDNGGTATLSIVLNGGSSAADATVATLIFSTVANGSGDLEFRPPDPPFMTKLTRASDSGTIIPAEVNAPALIVGMHTKVDVNGDGQKNGADIQPFVSTMLNPGAATPEARCAADANGDGEIEPTLDVPLFVDCLLNAVCPCT